MLDGPRQRLLRDLARGGAARELALQALAESIGGPLRPADAARALRKAYRTGAWRALTGLQLALLKAASRARVGEYRGERIKAHLRMAIAAVEAHTMRGAALEAAIAYAAPRRLVPASPGALARNLRYLLYLGRMIIEALPYFHPYMAR